MFLPNGFSTEATSFKLVKFKVPSQISVFEYPEVIYAFNVHLIDLKKKLAIQERNQDNLRDQLHSTEWHAGGSNDKQRDSKFKVLLQENEAYQQLERDIFELSWHIKTEEAALDKLTSEFTTAKIKLRNSILASELFSGLPVNPEER